MQKNTSGFTIVELMFSTVIFSVVLLLCLSALVQIGRMYYKGITTAQTQDTTRSVMDELSQSIQLSGGSISAPTGPAGPLVVVSGTVTNAATGHFCIGDSRYSYAMDRKQSDAPSSVAADKEVRHVLWVDSVPNCAAADLTAFPVVDLMTAVPTPAAGDHELLSQSMRITKLVMSPLTADNSTWQIYLTVAYGDDDVLIVDPSDATRRICQGSSIGTQFCAFSELSTVVKRRIL